MVLKKSQRRSVKSLQPNDVEKKCFSMQRAEIFLFAVLDTCKYRLGNFSKMKSLIAEQIKIKNKQLNNL